jgi:hypothetical protein
MTETVKERLKKLIELHKQAYIPLKEQNKKTTYHSSSKTKGFTRPEGKT